MVLLAANLGASFQLRLGRKSLVTRVELQMHVDTMK